MRGGFLFALAMLTPLLAFASEVDPSPSTSSQPEPPKSPADAARPSVSYPSNDYPPLSVRAGEEGRVMVRYLVREDGTVGSVVVTQSSGSPRLDQAAIALVFRWKFKPALRDGVPVPMWVSAAVVFKLH